MSLHEGISELSEKAVISSSLPPHVLFGSNADDITTNDPTIKTERVDELEMRVAAGNRAGLSDGFFIGSQEVSEDGEILSHDEAEERRVRRYIRNSTFAVGSLDNILIDQKTYNNILDDLFDVRQEAKENIKIHEQNLEIIEQQQEIVKEQLEEQQEILRSHDIEAAEQKDIAAQEVKVAENNHELAITDRERFNEQCDRMRRGETALGKDQMEYKVISTPHGEIYEYEDEGGRRLRTTTPDLATPEDIEAMGETLAKEVKDSAAEVVTANENYERVTSLSNAVRTDIETRIDDLQNLADDLEAIHAEEFAKLNSWKEIYGRADSGHDHMTSDEIREKLENDELTAADLKDISDLIDEANTLKDATPIDPDAGPMTFDRYQELVKSYNERQQTLDSMRTMEQDLQTRLDYINSEETKQGIADGSVTMDDFMGNIADTASGYWNSFTEQFSFLKESVPENMSPIPDPDAPQMTPIPTEQNMSVLPDDWYAQFQKWIEPSTSTTTASAKHDQGITSDVVSQPAFNTAATAETPAMSTADPSVTQKLGLTQSEPRMSLMPSAG